MSDLLEHASLLQTLALLAAYVGVLAWEGRHPLRKPADAAGAADSASPVRPVANFGLLLVNHGLPWLLLPLSSAITAWAVAGAGLGLLPALGVPTWLNALLAVLALDALAYTVHRALHHSEWLWRAHRVHHSDLAFDASLAFRFHPIETALQVLPQAALIALLGLSLEGVLLSALLGAAHNVFVHANATPSPRAEALLRRLLVTPDLHRVHHAMDDAAARRNFGIVFPWWDHLFGSFARPAAPPDRFGLADQRQPQRLTLARLLCMPLQRPPR